MGSEASVLTEAMQRYVLLVGVLVVIAFVSVVRNVAWYASRVDLRDIAFERAWTPEQQAQGLSGRSSLPRDHGMLFLFSVRDDYPFWMKDMHFPLDILWLDGDRVVDVVTLPPPTSTGAIPAHIPKAAATIVIELNAGVAAERKIQPGTRVLLPTNP